ncbi:MAG: DUF6175 family protein [Saprospiraceae bacterium]
MKNILLVLTMVLYSLTVFAQAKKPTLMVVPSDVWCNQNGYMTTFENQGITINIPDYKKAFQNNAELKLVISKINELMADRGFPLKDLEATIKSLEIDEAEDAMTQSSTSGSELKESPLDKLKKRAKADIWLEVTWTIKKVGPKTTITFNLRGLDAYTNKQIAGASGTGLPSMGSDLSILLEEAVLDKLPNFVNQLQAHFEDLFENGREIILNIKVWESSDTDLESEFDDEMLMDIIEYWVEDNTVKNRYSVNDATENRMDFEQVRIPLYNAKGRAIDARRWTNDLRKYLKSTYQIESKLMTKGLGRAQLVIGEK